MKAVKFAKKFRGDDVTEKKTDKDYPMGFGTADFLVNVGAIVYVEMALKWNHISDVHSLVDPGQFMPFFISLAQLFSVFYGISKALISKPRTPEETGGEAAVAPGTTTITATSITVTVQPDDDGKYNFNDFEPSIKNPITNKFSVLQMTTNWSVPIIKKDGELEATVMTCPSLLSKTRRRVMINGWAVLLIMDHLFE